MPAGFPVPISWCASPGWMSPSTPPTPNAHRGACPGRARRQLRWAAFEAAKSAARRGSPDHGYYHKLAAKHDGHNGKNPTLAVERKILRHCYHSLRELGDAALALPDIRPQEVAA